MLCRFLRIFLYLPLLLFHQLHKYGYIVLFAHCFKHTLFLKSWIDNLDWTIELIVVNVYTTIIPDCFSPPHATFPLFPLLVSSCKYKIVGIFKYKNVYVIFCL